MPPSPRIRSGTYVSLSVRPIKSSPMSIGAVASVLEVGSMKSTLSATMVSSALDIAAWLAEGRTDLNYGVDGSPQKPATRMLCTPTIPHTRTANAQSGDSCRRTRKLRRTRRDTCDLQAMPRRRADRASFHVERGVPARATQHHRVVLAMFASLVEPIDATQFVELP